MNATLQKYPIPTFTLDGKYLGTSILNSILNRWKLITSSFDLLLSLANGRADLALTIVFVLGDISFNRCALAPFDCFKFSLFLFSSYWYSLSINLSFTLFRDLLFKCGFYSCIYTSIAVPICCRSDSRYWSCYNENMSTVLWWLRWFCCYGKIYFWLLLIPMQHTNLLNAN